MSATVLRGDCLQVMQALRSESVDSIVCDPPSGIFFMGKHWDSDKGGRDQWISWLASVMREGLRVLKPGGHALVWALPRTSHWTGVALEEAGFEVRDRITHLFGSGFPKSLDVSKAMDKRGGAPHLVGEIGRAIKAARERRGLGVTECDARFCGGTTNWTWFEGRPKGQRAPTPETFARIVEAWPELAPLAEAVDEVEREVVGHNGRPAGWFTGGDGHDVTTSATDLARQWAGWGTALKPAAEDWWLARKPLTGTVAATVAAFGTGALNIAATRISSGGGSRNGGSNGGTVRAHEPSPVLRNWSTVLEEVSASSPDPHIRLRASGFAHALRCQSTPGSLADCPSCCRSDDEPSRIASMVARELARPDSDVRGLVGRELRAPRSRDHRANGHLSNVDDLARIVEIAYDKATQHPLPDQGRWPANCVLSHSPECREVGTRKVKGITGGTGNHSGQVYGARTNEGQPVKDYADADGLETVPAWECAPDCAVRLLDEQSGERKSPGTYVRSTAVENHIYGATNERPVQVGHGDTGGASRFMYCAKASRRERSAGLGDLPASHPTVKPLALCRWLARLITPPCGTILDPFAGSFSTGCAALLEGFHFIGIEREAEYCEIGRRRLTHWERVARRYRRLLAYRQAHPVERAAEPVDPMQASLFDLGVA